MEETYRLVKERLYCNLVRILWEHSDKSQDKKTVESMREVILQYAKNAFDKEYQLISGKNPDINMFLSQFRTDFELLGVGAPTHVFLGDVAKALHTDCRVSEYSGVSNALGAVLGEACSYESIYIGVDYTLQVSAESEAELDGDDAQTYVVYGPEKVICRSWEKAVAVASKMAEDAAVQKTIACGATDIYEVSSSVKKNEAKLYYGANISLGGDVIAYARGRFKID